MFQILSHSSHKTTDHCRFVSRDAVVFPECVARVPVSLWGSGGCGCVRNRSQPSATVRNRSCEDRMAVPMVSSAGVPFLEVSNVSLLRFAWQAWHFVTFRRVL